MPELLIELLSEEIPARMQARASADLRDLVTKGLGEAGLKFEGAQAFATPRRLALVVRGLPERSPDQTIEKKGPRIDAPPAAIDGFLRSTGLKREQLEERDMGKAGKVLFAVQKAAGRAAGEVASDVILAAITALPWPKSMRWASNQFRWVRPLHGIVTELDGKLLPLRLSLGDSNASIAAGTTTVGHRVLGNGALSVAGFDDYVAKLRTAYVVLDAEERKRIIREQGAALAAKEGLRVRKDDGLVDEVSGLVEWPVPLIGTIDGAFMDLPPEVLTTTMRTHQRYFALEKDGRLAPRFLVIANTVARDGGAAIVKGNERVLRARLSDAKFFWDQDRKVRLESRLPGLKEITFQAKLGTLDKRVSRIEALAAELCDLALPKADRESARTAARLSKADLRSGVVGEFPELQGTMGRYYALHDGLSADIANAIAEHYAPKGPEDRCPTAPVSVAVALAEKIDTLVGFWTIDEKPTGSKDPFALRRAALGVIRLVVENGLRVSLKGVFAESYNTYRQQGIEATEERKAKFLEKAKAAGRSTMHDTIDAVASAWYFPDLFEFLADRLKVQQRDRGIRHDLIESVFSLTGLDDIVLLLARVNALQKFLASEDGADLLVAYRRAANIVRIEEKKDSTSYRTVVDAKPHVLQQPEEVVLAHDLHTARKAVTAALANEDFAGAMLGLARLRTPVDAFFDKVTVNSDDKELRVRRLRLLAQITGTLEQVADFSKIEG